MIYITQLIYVVKGQEQVFEEFESVALAAIPKYNGKLLLRVRPPGDSLIDGSLEAPYEIHLVSFPSDQEFNNFMQDEDRRVFLHLKEQSIRAVWLMKGTRLGV